MFVSTTASGRVGSRRVLLVASFGAFLAFLDATIVNVAFPTSGESFPDTSIGAVVGAQRLQHRLRRVPGRRGRLADLLGRRRGFVAGVVVFTVASALCAAAPSRRAAGRRPRAAGARRRDAGPGVARPRRRGVPGGAALARHRAVGRRRRCRRGARSPGRAGRWSSSAGWRWAFLVNIPFGVAAVMAARRDLVESRAPGRRRLPDLAGAALLARLAGRWSPRHRQGRATGAGRALRCCSRSRPPPAARRRFVRQLAAPPLARCSTRAAAHPVVQPRERRDRARRARLLRLPAHQHPVAAVRLGVRRALGPVSRWFPARSWRPSWPARWGRSPRSTATGRSWCRVRWSGQAPTSGTTSRSASSRAFVSEWLPGQVLSGIGVGATLPLLGSAALAAVPGGRYATASAVVSSARQFGGVLGIAVLVVDHRDAHPGERGGRLPRRLAAVDRRVRRRRGRVRAARSARGLRRSRGRRRRATPSAAGPRDRTSRPAARGAEDGGRRTTCPRSSWRPGCPTSAAPAGAGLAAARRAGWLMSEGDPPGSAYVVRAGGWRCSSGPPGPRARSGRRAGRAGPAHRRGRGRRRCAPAATRSPGGPS